MRASTIAVLLALAACGGADGGADASTGPKGVAGSYALATYNGSPPPIVVLSEPANNLQIEIVSGVFSLNGIGTYSSVTGLKTTDKGVVTTSSSTCTGTYLANGNVLVFTEPQSGLYCGGNFTATWDGSNQLAFVFPNGAPAVFRR
jgi:hypothetical protein